MYMYISSTLPMCLFVKVILHWFCNFFPRCSQMLSAMGVTCKAYLGTEQVLGRLSHLQCPV